MNSNKPSPELQFLLTIYDMMLFSPLTKNKARKFKNTTNSNQKYNHIRIHFKNKLLLQFQFER